MSVRNAAESLADELSRYRWFVSIGIGTPDGIETIYVYVTSPRHKELTAIRDGFQGFPVVIETTGAARPAVPA